MSIEEEMLVISSEADIVTARTKIREVVTDLEFTLTDTTRIVTAVSELARNVYLYANSGTMYWHVHSNGHKQLIEIIFDDEGPGIPDVERALEEGYSMSGRMGHGLSGTQKLMDEFDIETNTDSGTTVTIRKYLP